MAAGYAAFRAGGRKLQRLPRIARLFAGPGPNPEVASLALAAKGIDVASISRKLKMKDGKPENRTAEFTAKNPAGTTPFVELEDGSILAESVAIARYADALFPDSPQLCGGPCAREVAEVEQWMQRVSIQLIQPWQRQFQYGEGHKYFSQFVPWAAESRPAVPGLRQMVVSNLGWLEEQMAAREAAGMCAAYAAQHSAAKLLQRRIRRNDQQKTIGATWTRSVALTRAGASRPGQPGGLLRARALRGAACCCSLALLPHGASRRLPCSVRRIEAASPCAARARRTAGATKCATRRSCRNWRTSVPRARPSTGRSRS
jgi:glutathione S-transferase